MEAARGWLAVSDDWLNEAARLARPAQFDPSVPNVARVWNFLVMYVDNDPVVLVDPGIATVNEWRSSPQDPPCPGGMPLFAAVARRLLGLGFTPRGKAPQRTGGTRR
jgi:hypothetical protein